MTHERKKELHEMFINMNYPDDDIYHCDPTKFQKFKNKILMFFRNIKKEEKKEYIPWFLHPRNNYSERPGID